MSSIHLKEIKLQLVSMIKHYMEFDLFVSHIDHLGFEIELTSANIWKNSELVYTWQLRYIDINPGR